LKRSSVKNTSDGNGTSSRPDHLDNPVRKNRLGDIEVENELNVASPRRYDRKRTDG